jgi:hypothetical protein
MRASGVVCVEGRAVKEGQRGDLNLSVAVGAGLNGAGPLHRY